MSIIKNPNIKPVHLWLFPILLVAYEACIYLSNDAYLPAIPEITRELMSNHHLAQLTLTTWFLGSGSMHIMLGPISDRYGRKLPLIFGGVLFVIATFVISGIQSMHGMLVARFIQGAMIPTMIVPGYAAIHELFDQKRAIHTLAWMSSITVLAPALGPLFGASVLHFLGWRWIFDILAFSALVLLVSLFLYMPETNLEGYKHPIQLGRLTKQYWSVLSNLKFLLTTISFCLLFSVMIAWIATGPFLVVDQFHKSGFTFGLFQAYIFGGFIIGTRVIKPLMEKINIQKLLNIGLTIAMLAGLSSIITSYIFPQILWSIIIPLIVLAFASGMSFPILNRLVIESSEEAMGSRVALFSTFISIFGVIGSGIVGFFYDGKLISYAFILSTFASLAFLVRILVCKLHSVNI